MHNNHVIEINYGDRLRRDDAACFFRSLLRSEKGLVRSEESSDAPDERCVGAVTWQIRVSEAPQERAIIARSGGR